MKKSLILLAVLGLSMGAQATVFGGDTTNNNQTYNQPQSHATGNGYGGQGGAGGAGGQGGSSVAGAAAGAAVVGSGNSSATGGNATGGSVLGSGNSNVRNDNTNAQQQGQAQGQQQSSRNSNRNTNTTGASTSNATTGPSTSGSSSGGNSMQGGAVTVEGDSYEAPRRAVATAYAAPLTSANGTCMGSSSGGAQGASFGVSFGSTWTDGGCDIRYDAEALRAAGLPLAAQARLCQKPDIAKAMESAGTPCPGTAVKTSAASTSTTRSAPTAQPQYTDPIVRQRLGLSPL